ncbi:MAG: tRNA lysidine(34) synthetase TilS [Thermodesulfobacteriota bacterium]|nr:MAG: tRNA lysidine(34) synthetase TilS [Thermodesulfobacteriota bacterium]
MYSPPVRRMFKKIRETIEKFSMLEEGDTVIAAVSGGADSVAMLHALYALRDDYSMDLVVCHLNHNLRGGESRRDMEFVRKTALGLGLEFFSRTLKPGALTKDGGEGLQAAAREKRLEFLEDCSKKFKAQKVALGHTLDDQAETVLMRLLKGSALSGLSGMRPKRDDFIRPMIDVTREEILLFIKDSRADYVTDSSNLKTDYLRNDIRLNLLPYIMERYNPNIARVLSRTAKSLGRDGDFIDGIADFLGVIVKRTSKRVVMDRIGLKDLHGALLSRVFLKAAGFLNRREGLYGPHIEAFMDIVHSKRPNARASLPGGLTLKREYDQVVLSLGRAGVEQRQKPFKKTLRAPGEASVKEAGVRFKASVLKQRPGSLKSGKRTAYFDYNTLPGPLVVRSPLPGDRLIPMGMEGHKKLKKIFIDMKIPASKRQGTPLLCSGGEILWAVGVSQSERCKVVETTSRVLKVECRSLKR